MDIIIKSLYNDSREINLIYNIYEYAPKYKLCQRNIETIDFLSVMLDFIIYEKEYGIYMNDILYKTKELNTLKAFFVNKFLTNGFLYSRFKDGELESELSIFLLEILSVNDLISIDEVNSKYFDSYKFQEIENEYQFSIKMNNVLKEIENLNIISNNYIEITFLLSEEELDLENLDEMTILNFNEEVININKINLEYWFYDILNKTYYLRVKK